MCFIASLECMSAHAPNEQWPVPSLAAQLHCANSTNSYEAGLALPFLYFIRIKQYISSKGYGFYEGYVHPVKY
jgi:hypothetical protein